MSGDSLPRKRLVSSIAEWPNLMSCFQGAHHATSFKEGAVSLS